MKFVFDASLLTNEENYFVFFIYLFFRSLSVSGLFDIFLINVLADHLHFFSISKHVVLPVCSVV